MRTGNIVEIAAGACEPMPHDERRSSALAPFHEVELTIEHGRIVRARITHRVSVSELFWGVMYRMQKELNEDADSFVT
jgi:hypothetical protein